MSGEQHVPTSEVIVKVADAMRGADREYSAREHSADAGVPGAEPGDWFEWMARAALVAAAEVRALPDCEVLAAEVDRIFGWQHLRKYAGMTEAWMDKLRDGIVRVVLARLGRDAPR